MTDQLELLLELVTQEEEEETLSWELGPADLGLAAGRGQTGGGAEGERSQDSEIEDGRLEGEGPQTAWLERMSAGDAEPGTDQGETQGGREDLPPWDGGRSRRSLGTERENADGLTERLRRGEGPASGSGVDWLALQAGGQVRRDSGPDLGLRRRWTTADRDRSEMGEKDRDSGLGGAARSGWGELPRLEMAGVAETGSVWNALGLYQSVVKTERAVRTASVARGTTTDRQMTAGAPSLTVDELDRAVRRDSRRYDGAMELY